MIDPLTLDQMRVLVAVAEAGSFSAAARRLGRVQSAISQAVQTMEATLGVALFDRSTRTPALTDAGAAIVKRRARDASRARRRCARARESIAEDVEPELTLAVDAIVPDAAADDEPRTRCAANSPTCRRPCSPRRSAAPSNGCASGAARMAIYPLPRGPPRDLNAEFLTRSRAHAGRRRRPPARPRARRRSRRETLEPHVQLVLTDRTVVRAEHSGRRRQPPCLALRRSRHPAGVPARRLRLVQHALAHGRGPYRRRSAETARHRRRSPGRIAALCRSRTRTRARARRPLARRRPARTAEDLPGRDAAVGRASAGSRRRGSFKATERNSPAPRPTSPRSGEREAGAARCLSPLRGQAG